MSAPLRFKRSYLPWLLEVVVAFAARLLYRVRFTGVEKLPHGGALIAANHLSYADVIVLQLACPRKLRFVGYEGLRESHWCFRWLFQVTQTVPISTERPLDSTRRVIELLKRGEYVLMFVEGAISRTGQLMRIRRGFEVMARKAGVPVVPVAHDGLWGSVFSFSGNKYLFKSPRIMRTHVFVNWGDPIDAETVNPLMLRKVLLDLGEQAFQQRPQLKRHLGREVVRGLARRPWRIEIVDCTAERKVVKAGQLLGVAAAFSRHIKRTIPDKRVGIVLPPGAGASIANLAVLCAGKVPVNLNFTAGRSAIETSLKLGEVTTVITANALKPKVKDFPWPERTLDFRTEITAMGGKKAILPWLLGAWILPNQWMANLLGLPKRGDRAEAGLLFTSGSSGEPKGVSLTHRNILGNCWQISSLSVLPETATMLACLPVFHSFGFTVTLWYPMMRGCHIVTVPSPLDTRKIIDAIREEEATVLVGAPTFLRPLVKRAEPRDLRSLNLVVSGAEKLPLDLYKTYRRRFNIEIMQGYGLTETSPASNINQPNPVPIAETAEPQVGKRLGSVGRMMPGMTARILNPDTMEEIAPTEQGLVVMKGANVFGGYLKNEEKTRDAFHHGWFVTGDLGRFDEDGFLFIEGRLSRFSKIGGEMVPHGTIERNIIEEFRLEEGDGYVLVVMGAPDPQKGEALVLLTTVPFERNELRDRLLKAGLPNLWVPRLIHQVDSVPVLGTGKLDLKGCKELAAKVAAGEV